ncbi:MAG: ABC transporter substrate-binding protein [Vibrio sp.]
MFQHEMGKVDFLQPPTKIVVLDWVLTEHLLALGVIPYGVADADGYKNWVVEPALPDTVINIGSRREPNLELLEQMKPDLILMSQAMSAAYDKLNSIAPTIVLSVYTDNHQPLDAAKAQLRTLGKLLHRNEQAQRVIADVEQTITNNKEALMAVNPPLPPLLFIRFIDDKHIRVHGRYSLAGETIHEMGLRNAWEKAGNTWGFSSSTIQQLAPFQTVKAFYFGPLTDSEKARIDKNPIWNVMGFVQQNNVYELPPIWTFGGVKAAQRLSDMVTKQLLSAPEGHE